MKFKKKLLNPFVLAFNGFVAGAILFYAAGAPEADPPQQPPSAQADPATENPGA